MKPVSLSEAVGNPVCWAACVRTRHVTSCRVKPCLASREMLTYKKTNTFYYHHYHHYHHGACPVKDDYRNSCLYLTFISLPHSHSLYFSTISPLFPLPFYLFTLKFSLTSVFFRFFIPFLYSLPFFLPYSSLSFRHSSPLILETTKDTCSLGFVDVLVTTLQSCL
jgi:hypothetical protein